MRNIFDSKPVKMRARPTRRDGGFNAKPSRQTLFSFVPKNGLEWSSDSDDSDYEPGSSCEGVKSEKKRWKSRSPSGGKRSSSRTKQTIDDHVEVWEKPGANGHLMWAQSLPSELLVIIFRMVIDDNGSLPFLCRASHVCQSWRAAAMDCRLWQEVDLAHGKIKQVPRTLRWLVDHRLTRVTSLNLSWWKALKLEDFRFLFDSCRQLETLNLSHCKLTPGAMKALAGLPHLHHLNLGSSADQVMLPSVLSPVLETLGPRLRELTLSGNRMKGFNLVMTALMENCPNLTLLDFSACQYSSTETLLKIEKLQHSCRLLRILRLHNTKLSAAPANREERLNSPGFPALEEINVSVTDRRLFIGFGIASVFTYDDDFIARALHNSPNLRDLDVNMCIEISDASLVSLPAQCLKHLRISRCSSGRIYTGLCEIINKWKHCLESVDLSWNRYSPGALDQALRLMAEYGTPAHSIGLAGTNASTLAIRALLTGCTRLTTLDLTSCRGLPRGAKRRYEGREALGELFNTLTT